MGSGPKSRWARIILSPCCTSCFDVLASCVDALPACMERCCEVTCVHTLGQGLGLEQVLGQVLGLGLKLGPEPTLGLGLGLSM